MAAAVDRLRQPCRHTSAAMLVRRCQCGDASAVMLVAAKLVVVMGCWDNGFACSDNNLAADSAI